MTMHNNGLTKLQEECGELVAIAAKKAAFMHTDVHPDGNGSMKRRLEEEVADVLAAIGLINDTFELDEQFVMTRAEQKLALFRKWHADKNV